MWRSILVIVAIIHFLQQYQVSNSERKVVARNIKDVKTTLKTRYLSKQLEWTRASLLRERYANNISKHTLRAPLEQKAHRHRVATACNDNPDNNHFNA